jgi:hypothetical protein
VRAAFKGPSRLADATTYLPSPEKRRTVLLVACFLLAVLTVPLAGGSLARLAEHRFRRPWALAAALAVQIVVISVVPDGNATLLAAAHLASYGFAIVFLLANRSLPGLWVLGLGTGMNLAAIAANGGVMPATRSALVAAGQLSEGGDFVNSGVLEDPKLLYLGDIFALPQPWPLANVFSAGDVCIVVGAALVLHQLCRSRLAGGSRRITLRPLKPVGLPDDR